MAGNAFDRLLENLRKQREDLQKQIEGTSESQTITSDLVRSIEDLRERAEKTAAKSPKQE